MPERIIVGMSGGIDSAVAAALLKKSGYEVIGITLSFDAVATQGKKYTQPGRCGFKDSRRLAHKLRIKHHVLDAAENFKTRIIADFFEEYQKGRTPNPCVRCNRYIKFVALAKKARELGAVWIASGHYCRIAKIRDKNRQPLWSGQIYGLRKAKDRIKDQSYFLYRLSQKQLKQIIFPLGDYTKAEVRAMAKKLALPVLAQPESQDICFLKNTAYRRFLKKQVSQKIKPGPIIDREGRILGRHKGISFYTIGQRQGLGLALGYRAYVTDIDPKKNRITVGKKEECYRREFLVKDAHFIFGTLRKNITAKVRIRYNHPEAEARLFPRREAIKVRYLKPQFAITCGQSAVFYKGDVVLGGGIIDKVLN